MIPQRPDSYTARSYVLIDKTVRAVERWLTTVNQPACSYEQIAVNRRISQAIVMRLVDPFLRESIKGGGREGANLVDVLPQHLRCGEMRLNTETGAISPSIKLLLLSAAKFVALWLIVLACFVRSMWNKKNSGSAILIFGVPDANLRVEGSAQRFEDFCSNGPLEILSKANKCIVQGVGTVKAGNSNKYVYTRFPLLTLFLRNRLRLNECIGFIKQHIYMLIEFIFLTFRNPIACLLWRDFAEHAVVSVMNKKKLIEGTVITNTNWFQQFLWMTDLPERNFKTYMALYSLNSSALKFKDDPLGVTHPCIRHLRTDLVWIWDSFYEKILNDEGIFSKTQVVGPILWRMKSNVPMYRKPKFYRLCIFDVSPMGTKALLNRGMLGNYYNAGTMKSFLDDILYAVDVVKKQLAIEIEVVIKHKRTPTPVYDNSYFSHVNELCKSYRHLRLVGEDIDLFKLIEESTLVVVIPYSSPGYLANYLGIPTIFYDPTNEILPTQEVVYPIVFSAKKENLLNDIIKIIGRSGF